MSDKVWGCRLPALIHDDVAARVAFWKSTIPPEYEPAGEPEFQRHDPQMLNGEPVFDETPAYTLRGPIKRRSE